MAAHDDNRARDIARKQRSLTRARELRIDDAIKQNSQSRAGREFLWWLLQVGKVGSQPFTANALNTAFQCGELNVGNAILQRLITVNPAIYVQMQQENQNEYDQLVQAEAAVADGGRDTESGSGGHPGGYDNDSLE